VTYDLVIRRGDPTDQIDRQVWLTFAIDTVALVQLAGNHKEREGIVFPAFGLYRHFDQPVLFWQEGVVVVKYASDEHLSDLRVIADHLRADLVRTDSDR
jgi:hypothetical protein